jgi:hypothetical protein
MKTQKHNETTALNFITASQKSSKAEVGEKNFHLDYIFWNT